MPPRHRALQLADDQVGPFVAQQWVAGSRTAGSVRVECYQLQLWFNAERGYVSCELTPKQWSSFYRTVPFVTKPGAPLVTRKAFVVEAGKPGAQEV